MGRGGRPRLDRCAVLGGPRLQHRLRLQHGLFSKKLFMLQLNRAFVQLNCCNVDTISSLTCCAFKITCRLPVACSLSSVDH
jgi:hypothetical protein